jgi:putative transposase
LGHRVCAESDSGQYFYLYLFLVVFSRKAVGAEVHAEESMEHSSRLLDRICREEGIEKHQVSVHVDNGGAMKGSTMLATMQRLGVMPSFSGRQSATTIRFLSRYFGP